MIATPPIEPPEQARRDGQDPWDWDIDQVVDVLCDHNGPRLYLEDPALLPDPRSFERALRENFVNGRALLTDIHQVSLRDDLGIKPLGHRSTIMRVVYNLRRESPRYINHLNDNDLFFSRSSHDGRSNLINVSGFGSSFPASVYLPSRQISGDSESTRASSMPSNSIGDSSELQTPMSRHLFVVQPPDQSATNQESVVDETNDSASSQGTLDPRESETNQGVSQYVSDMASGFENGPRSSEMQSSVRANEVYVMDANGRKRRKLTSPFDEASGALSDLTLTAGQIDMTQVQDSRADDGLEATQQLPDSPSAVQSLQADDSTFGKDQTDTSTEELIMEDEYIGDILPDGSLFVDDQGRKRMRPVLVSRLGDATRDLMPEDAKGVLETDAGENAPLLVHAINDSLSRQIKTTGRKAHRRPDQMYLGPESLPIDRVFYGDTALCKELPTDTDDPAPTPNSTDVMVKPFAETFGTGLRLYVNSRMQYMLRSAAEEQIVRGKTRTVGKIPYPARVARKHDALSITTYSQTSDHVTASRMDRSTWTRSGFVKPLSCEPSAQASILDPFAIDGKASENEVDDWDFLSKWKYVEAIMYCQLTVIPAQRASTTLRLYERWKKSLPT